MLSTILIVLLVVLNVANSAGAVWLYRNGAQWQARAMELDAELMRLRAQNTEQSKRLVESRIRQDRAGGLR